MFKLALPLLLAACEGPSENNNAPKEIGVVLHRVMPEVGTPDEVISRDLADQMIARANELYAAAGFHLTLVDIVNVRDDHAYDSNQSDGDITKGIVNNYIASLEKPEAAAPVLNIFSLPEVTGIDANHSKDEPKLEDEGGYFSPSHPQWVVAGFSQDPQWLGKVLAHELGHLGGLPHNPQSVMCTGDGDDYVPKIKGGVDCPEHGSDGENFNAAEIKQLRRSYRLNQLVAKDEAPIPMPPTLEIPLGCEENAGPLTLNDLRYALNDLSNGGTLRLCQNVVGKDALDIVVNIANLKLKGDNNGEPVTIKKNKADGVWMKLNGKKGELSIENLKFDGISVDVDGASYVDITDSSFQNAFNGIRIVSDGVVHIANSRFEMDDVALDIRAQATEIIGDVFSGNRTAITAFGEEISMQGNLFAANHRAWTVDSLSEGVPVDIESQNNIYWVNGLPGGYYPSIEIRSNDTNFSSENDGYYFNYEVMRIQGVANIYNAIFAENWNPYGEIVTIYGAANMDSVQFIGNKGGALRMNGDLGMDHGQFYGNTSIYDGGAINIDGNAIIQNSGIRENQGQNGGALSWDGGWLEIRDSTINDNRATSNGGALNLMGPKVTVVGTSLSGNQALPSEFHFSDAIALSPSAGTMNVVVQGGSIDNANESGNYAIDLRDSMRDHAVSLTFDGVQFGHGMMLSGWVGQDDRISLENCSFNDNPVCDITVDGWYVDTGVCENSPTER